MPSVYELELAELSDARDRFRKTKDASLLQKEFQARLPLIGYGLLSNTLTLEPQELAIYSRVLPDDDHRARLSSLFDSPFVPMDPPKTEAAPLDVAVEPKLEGGAPIEPSAQAPQPAETAGAPVEAYPASPVAGASFIRR